MGSYKVDFDLLNSKTSLLILLMWILWTIFFLYTQWIFIRNRNKFNIYVRSPFLISTSSIGQYLILTSMAFKLIITPENFLNFFDLIYLWIELPLSLIPYPLRSIQYIFKYHVDKVKVEKEDWVNEEEPPNRISAFFNWFTNPNNKKYISNTAFFIYEIMLLIPTVGFGIYRGICYKENWPKPENVGTCFTDLSYKWMIAIIVVVSVVSWICIYFLLNINDIYRINHELITISVVWLLLYPLYIGFGWASLEPEKTHIPTTIAPIVQVIICFIQFIVSFSLPVSESQMINPNFQMVAAKYQEVKFYLADKEALKILLDFATASQNVENVLFLIENEKFRAITDFEQQRKKAEYIIETYVKNKSKHCINISGGLRNETLLGYETMQVTSDTFKLCQQEITKLINQDIIPKMTTSDPAMMALIKRRKIGIGADDYNTEVGTKTNSKTQV